MSLTTLSENITSNGTYEYNPPTGYDGFSSAIINVNVTTKIPITHFWVQYQYEDSLSMPITWSYAPPGSSIVVPRECFLIMINSYIPEERPTWEFYFIYTSASTFTIYSTFYYAVLTLQDLQAMWLDGVALGTAEGYVVSCNDNPTLDFDDLEKFSLSFRYFTIPNLPDI